MSKIDLKNVATYAAGAALGNALAEHVVLQTEPDGPGFVPVNYGFGMDDVVRALLAAGGILVVKKVL